MSNQRFIILVFTIAAVIILVMVRSAIIEISASIGVPDPTVLGLHLSSVAGVVGAVVGFAVLIRNTRAVTFVDEVIVELRKVYWPKKEETVNSTSVVLAATAGLAAAIAIYDFIWAKITGTFLYS